MNELLSQIVATFDDPETVTGIIIHGSWAKNKNDKASDIDLLIIQRSEEQMVEQNHSVLNFHADISRGTLSELRRRLYKNDPLNNNFILNAAREGVICLDRTGCASLLKTDADVLWKTGPLPVSATEIRATRKGLYRMLTVAIGLAERASMSKEAMLLAEMRSHQVVIQSIYLYHRVRRRWTTGFPQMLHRLKIENSILYELWKQYVDAQSQDQRIKVANLLVKAVYEE